MEERNERKKEGRTKKREEVRRKLCYNWIRALYHESFSQDRTEPPYVTNVST